MKLLDKIKNKRLKVGIIGLGYVGLPLAIEFAKSGIETIGIDINGQKVSMLNAGKSYIQDIDSQLIKHLVEKSKFTATNDFKAIASIDVVFVCVPTPFNKAKAPDISFMINAAKSISSYLSKEKLIVLQSTTYPGTTDEDIIPILEQSGLKAGKDFYIAFSPERIDPGNKKFNVKNTPKIVGGLTLKCADLTKRVFSLIIDEKNIHVVSCPRSAEMCKLLENIFRSVNIALVNELLILSNRMGIDFWEVIDAAATKPFGFLPFYPGPGVGGHCIPVDPYYLSWKAREYNFFANFIELAAEVNQNMPYYAVEKIETNKTTTLPISITSSLEDDINKGGFKCQ